MPGVRIRHGKMAERGIGKMAADGAAALAGTVVASISSLLTTARLICSRWGHSNVCRKEYLNGLLHGFCGMPQFDLTLFEGG